MQNNKNKNEDQLTIQESLQRVEILIENLQEKYQIDVFKLRKDLFRIWSDLKDDIEKIKVQIEYNLSIDLKNYRYMPADQFKHQKEIELLENKIQHNLINVDEAEVLLNYHKIQYSIIKEREKDKIEVLRKERQQEEDMYMKMLPLLEKLQTVVAYYNQDLSELRGNMNDWEDEIIIDILNEKDIFSEYLYYIKMLNSTYFMISIIKEEFDKNQNLLNYQRNELLDQLNV